MIVCDTCSKHISMNDQEIVSTIKLAWQNYTHQPPVSTKAYHLCEKCAKELNKHIEEIREKEEKK